MTELHAAMLEAVDGKRTTPSWISDALERLALEGDDGDVAYIVDVCMPQGTRAQVDYQTQALAWAAGIFAASTDSADDTTLSVALVIVSRLNRDQTFWSTFQAAHDSNDALVARLVGEVERRTLTVSPSVTAPISGAETATRLRTAEEAQDWPELCRFLSHLPWHRHDEVHYSTVRALAVLDPGRLAAAAARTETVLGAHFVLEPLSEVDALTVAEATADVRVRFAALVHGLIPQRRMPTETERQCIERILDQAAGDSRIWLGWMQALNANPLGVPGLQIPLGSVLARAPAPAVTSYVSTLDLSAAAEPGHPSSHAEISECLDAFRSQASEEQRLLLWESGYERWREWDFGAGYLFGVARTQLDYAALGWLVEGDTSKVIVREMAACSDELSKVEHAWHASVLDLRSARFKILSRLQVYAMADQIRHDGGDWTTIGRIYSLTAFDTGYYKAKYPD